MRWNSTRSASWEIWTSVQLEVLKSTRSRTLSLLWLSPTVVNGLVVVAFSVLGGARLTQPQVVMPLYGFWSLLLLPFLIFLQVALAADLEHKGGMLAYLFTLPVRRSSYYWAKFLVVEGWLLASSILFALQSVAVLAFLAAYRGVPHFSLLAFAGQAARLNLQFFGASTLMVAIHLWFSMRNERILHAVGLGLAGVVANFFLINLNLTHLSPWALPLSVMLGKQVAWCVIGGAGLGLLVNWWAARQFDTLEIK